MIHTCRISADRAGINARIASPSAGIVFIFDSAAARVDFLKNFSTRLNSFRVVVSERGKEK